MVFTASSKMCFILLWCPLSLHRLKSSLLGVRQLGPPGRGRGAGLQTQAAGISMRALAEGTALAVPSAGLAGRLAFGRQTFGP